MTSELQILANRENDKLGEVKTEAGKAIVRLNAVTHGLLTKEAVVHGESIEVFNEIRDNLMKEHEPQGELERLQRSRRGENIPPHWPLMWTFRSKAKKVHVSQNCQPVESGNQ